MGCGQSKPETMDTKASNKSSLPLQLPGVVRTSSAESRDSGIELINLSSEEERVSYEQKGNDSMSKINIVKHSGGKILYVSLRCSF